VFKWPEKAAGAFKLKIGSWVAPGDKSISTGFLEAFIERYEMNDEFVGSVVLITIIVGLGYIAWCMKDLLFGVGFH
jgi:hypothetical protein